MSRFLRGRLSFSNVVAVLALFVALGGSAYAATKFSGKQIKPKTIPANRIKPNSLTSTQIKDGSLKAVKSANAISTLLYQRITVLISASNPNAQTISVPCGSGKAVGGGALSSNPDTGAFINDQGIAPDGNGYVAHVFSGTVDSTVTVTAACIPASQTIG